MPEEGGLRLAASCVGNTTLCDAPGELECSACCVCCSRMPRRLPVRIGVIFGGCRDADGTGALQCLTASSAAIGTIFVMLSCAASWLAAAVGLGAVGVCGMLCCGCGGLHACAEDSATPCGSARGNDGVDSSSSLGNGVGLDRGGLCRACARRACSSCATATLWIAPAVSAPSVAPERCSDI